MHSVSFFLSSGKLLAHVQFASNQAPCLTSISQMYSCLLQSANLFILFYKFFQLTHSQSITSPPLKPWIVVEKDGTNETAHCTCMAGLGETSSHIATTLFAIEAAVKILKERTCTSLPCTWLEPSGGCVNFAEGNQIDCTSPSHKTKL